MFTFIFISISMSIPISRPISISVFIIYICIYILIYICINIYIYICINTIINIILNQSLIKYMHTIYTFFYTYFYTCTHIHQIYFLRWSSVTGSDLYGPGLGKHQLFGVSEEQDPGRRCTMLHDVARHWTCCAGCTSCPCKSLWGIQWYDMVCIFWKNPRVKISGRSCTMLHWH